MRIDDRSGMPPAPKPARSGARTPDSSAFRVETGATPKPQEARAAHIGASEDIAALLQLQIDRNPDKERRKRAVRRGVGLLDRLDKLKAALLIGADLPADWDALAADFGRARDGDVPAEIASLLDEIDVRVAVELAKRGR